MLAQGGEFAFVLLSLAAELKVLPEELNKLLIIVVVISMALTPGLASIGKYLADKYPEEDETGTSSAGQVVLRAALITTWKEAGVHRVLTFSMFYSALVLHVQPCYAQCGCQVAHRRGGQTAWCCSAAVMQMCLVLGTALQEAAAVLCMPVAYAYTSTLPTTLLSVLQVQTMCCV